MNLIDTYLLQFTRHIGLEPVIRSKMNQVRYVKIITGGPCITTLFSGTESSVMHGPPVIIILDTYKQCD